MKYFFTSLFLLFFFRQVNCQVYLAFTADNTYRLGAGVADSSLTSNQGKIEFHFSSHSNYGDTISCNSKVLFTCNGVLDTADYVSLTKPSRILTPGKYVFLFYINDRYREVATDTITITAGTRIPLYINFNQPQPVIELYPYEYMRYSMQEDKPVIYVYSEQLQQVSLKLQIKGDLGFTYPSYNDGWNFTADKNGDLVMNGKHYPYLFWEGQTDLDYSGIDWNEGAVVKKDSLVSFFERSLSEMGLSEKEITDYITYWVPRMQKNDSCYIHFIMNDDYDKYASMDITPIPDSKFQVFMIWSAADRMQNSKLIAQSFIPFERKGLTVVEWGGGELPTMPLRFDPFNE